MRPHNVAVTPKTFRINLAKRRSGSLVHGIFLLIATIDQVVHDYGDFCQAIIDLAVERDPPISIDEFRTLNRCLDNAIADAVTEFSFQSDLPSNALNLPECTHESHFPAMP